MSRHLIESARAEDEMAKNQMLMSRVKTRLRWYRWTMIFGNIVLWLGSLLNIYLWVSLHNTGYAFITYFLAEEIPDVIYFPVCAITALAGLPFVILAFCADAFEKTSPLYILSIVSFILLILCFINIIISFEPVRTRDSLIFMLLMIAEVCGSFFFMTAFSTMEKLKKEPGYPDFSFNISGLLSQDQQKYVDYQNARLRGEYSKPPMTKLPSDDDFEMGDLELPEVNGDYEIVDVRRKPL